MAASRFFIEAHECASAPARVRARQAAFIAAQFGCPGCTDPMAPKCLFLRGWPQFRLFRKLFLAALKLLWDESGSNIF
jgi:hypothetical protein